MIWDVGSYQGSLLRVRAYTMQGTVSTSTQLDDTFSLVVTNVDVHASRSQNTIFLPILLQYARKKVNPSHKIPKQLG